MVLPNHQETLNIGKELVPETSEDLSVVVLPNHQQTLNIGKELVPETSEELSVVVLPNHQETLNIGKQLVPETSENRHILTRLSARENFFEFCRCESFKTFITLKRSK